MTTTKKPVREKKPAKKTPGRLTVPPPVKAQVRRWIVDHDSLISSNTMTRTELRTKLFNDVPPIEQYWYSGLLPTYCKTVGVSYKPKEGNGTVPTHTIDTEVQLVDHDQRIARLAEAVTTLRTEVIELRNKLHNLTTRNQLSVSDEWDLR